jgi:hypothetical protein
VASGADDDVLRALRTAGAIDTVHPMHVLSCRKILALGAAMTAYKRYAFMLPTLLPPPDRTGLAEVRRAWPSAETARVELWGDAAAMIHLRVGDFAGFACDDEAMSFFFKHARASRCVSMPGSGAAAAPALRRTPRAGRNALPRAHTDFEAAAARGRGAWADSPFVKDAESNVVRTSLWLARHLGVDALGDLGAAASAPMRRVAILGVGVCGAGVTCALSQIATSAWAKAPSPRCSRWRSMAADTR